MHRFSALPNLVSFRGRKWPGEGGRELIAAPARPFVRAKSGKERACPLSVTTSQLMIESRIDRAANAERLSPERARLINAPACLANSSFPTLVFARYKLSWPLKSLRQWGGSYDC